MKQHKWHKEIKAWADGAIIQEDISEIKEEPIWIDMEFPQWDEFTEYRIKPQPKEPQYLYAFLLEVGTEQGQIVFGLDDSHIEGFNYIGKIKLEEDKETI